MANDVCYIYCAWDERRWELLQGETALTALTPSALYHLLVTGAVRGEQLIRREGEETAVSASQQRELLKRTAFGQILPVLFKQEDLLWYYKGMTESICGPIDGNQMLNWFRGGYLYEKMRVAGQKDLGNVPTDSEFLSLKDLLWFMSQPTFCSEFLSAERPIKDLKHIHCGKESFGAWVGEWEDIQQLPTHPQIAALLSGIQGESHKEAGDENMASVIQEAIQEALPAALKLFYAGERSWYYLGQRSYSTIHGPYDGQRMFSWFQQGWLSPDLLVWSTSEDLVSIDMKDFRPLKEHLAQKPRDPDDVTESHCFP